MILDDIKLFMYTVDEYRKFYDYFEKYNSINSTYNFLYIATNTKLMILRKYGSNNENVNIAKIINMAIFKYKDCKSQFENLLNEYNNIEKQQLEYILPNGAKLNLYQTIEDVMYGNYLHADKDKINRLLMAEGNLRLICVKNYVDKLERIIFKLYDLLENNGEKLEKPVINKATVVHLGKPNIDGQKIEKSTYWSNLYGKDANGEDIQNIVDEINEENLTILDKVIKFTNALDSEDIQTLNNLIDYTTKNDWGDFSFAIDYYKRIIKPGISTKVRYNDNHTMAYVNIYPYVDSTFIFDTPHMTENIFQVVLRLDEINHSWKIHSMGKF